jgi:hypothetical protein
LQERVAKGELIPSIVVQLDVVRHFLDELEVRNDDAAMDASPCDFCDDDVVRIRTHGFPQAVG